MQIYYLNPRNHKFLSKKQSFHLHAFVLIIFGPHNLHSLLKKKTEVYALEELFEYTMPSKERIQIKLKVPEEIVTLIRGCYPQLKSKIRAGLRHIMAEPESGKGLKDELEELQNYRIGRFRII